MPQDIFYTYVLLDTTKPGAYDYGRGLTFKFEPFYVGKGKGARHRAHFSTASLRSNSKKNSRIKRIKRVTCDWPKVVIKKKNIDEYRAFKCERMIIDLIGRKDKKQGPLLNACAGGAGTSGRKDSPEVVAKRVESFRAYYEANPEAAKQRTVKVFESWASWSDERYEAFIEKCRSNNVSHTPSTRRKMSHSGKLRVQAETQEQRDKRSKALSRSHKRVWSSYTEKEREARSQALAEAHARKSTKEKKKVAKKISASIARIHATRTPKEAEQIHSKISQTLKNKSPEHKQRIACGNAMRGMMKRYDIDLHHSVLRPKLDKIIHKFSFDGKPETKEKFLRKVQTILQQAA